MTGPATFPSPSGPGSDALSGRALALLERWARAAEEYWAPEEDDATLGCFGPGYLTWGVQANWNYVAALATVAAHSADPAPAGRCRERSLAALRHLLATHVTGSRAGRDGRRWGHSWISQLGIERAAHGVALLEPHLTDDDRDALRRMLESEAGWLLRHGCRGQHAGVIAGLWNDSGRNAPESNVWSGCLLWRAARTCPAHPDAAAWAERAHEYLINGVSVEADASDSTVVAGRPVRERHVGANFFPHYALDHHGYLNVGYMVICVSNAAMLHFDMRRAGLEPPESLLHHQADLWRALRPMIFEDGRLARIGGDSRVRYAYCQEYLLPALLFAADRLGDTGALDLAARQLGLIEREAATSGDGLFYSRRLSTLREGNPHYYTRLESDRAAVLSMLIGYLPLVGMAPGAAGTAAPTAPPPADPGETIWIEEAHGAAMHRSKRRLASFAWRGQGLAQALCLPPDAGDLAEWTSNLCPVVRFLGDDRLRPGAHRRLVEGRVRAFPGGFAACGAIMEGVEVRIDEGALCTDQALTRLAWVALPDGRTCVGFQLVTAATDRVGLLAELKGLHLNVPNDLFNGFRRRFEWEGGGAELASPPDGDEMIAVRGTWLCVDGRLGVRMLYGADALAISRSARRRGGRYESLFVEEICAAARIGVRRVPPGRRLLDLAFAVLSGSDAGETAALEAGRLELPEGMLRGVRLVGADGRRYELIANLGDAPAGAEVSGRRVSVAGGEVEVFAEG